MGGYSTHLLVCVISVGFKPWLITRVEADGRIAALGERVVAELRLVDVVKMCAIRLRAVIIIIVTVYSGRFMPVRFYPSRIFLGPVEGVK